MATTETKPREDSANRIIESIEDAEKTALEAVRRFLDTVNGVFPDVRAEDAPRSKIIDSAFRMTEQLVGASNQLAQKVVRASQVAQVWRSVCGVASLPSPAAMRTLRKVLLMRSFDLAALVFDSHPDR